MKFSIYCEGEEREKSQIHQCSYHIIKGKGKEGKREEREDIAREKRGRSLKYINLKGKGKGKGNTFAS